MTERPAVLDLTPPPSDVRNALEEITKDVLSDKDLADQILRISDLASRYPHSIELVAAAVPTEPSTIKFTCFQYAFELTDPPPVIVYIATVWPDVYPSPKFVHYLIEQHLTEAGTGELSDGDVVVYFASGAAKHAGRVRGGRVVSKWGTGHLWSHGLYEVPAKYGSEVRFFRPLTRRQSQEAFLEFAERETGQPFPARRGFP